MTSRNQSWSRVRMWAILSATALLLAIRPGAAVSELAASGDLAKTFYGYDPSALKFSSATLLEAPRYRMIRLTFPSQVQSPSPNNNLVRGYYYQPKVEGRVPAVVVLHGFGAPAGGSMEKAFCRSLAEQGMAAFFLVLPYHLDRRAEGRRNGEGFMSADPQHIVQSGRQAIVDLRCVLDWLESRPEVDAQRLGVVGISLGGIMANLAMGVDDRLTAGVSIVGGGDLAGIIWRSPLTLPWKWRMQRAGMTQPILREALHTIEPLTFTDRNRPRRVLMINGYHDVIVPGYCTRELWEALARPPIIWTNSGHFSLVLNRQEVFETAYRFLRGKFGMGPPWTPRLIRVCPVKVALLWNHRQGLRPGLFKELLCSPGPGRLSLDLGLTTKGLFVGAGAMLTEGVAVGVGIPIGKGSQHPEPYLSLQLVL